MGKLPCNKEYASKLFDDISKEHNFIFETDESHFWNVESIDKLLKR